ncbi:hypothetical protein O181_042413 [Austropuccinia psidii MF-1]|uniref:Uncharacterized protein n=1 Tax=Austropuccinia psidii MF-1 TaxID=1389203 RepID=A0A9Q3DJC4_9BASI|nr:hypothetical protein [Austropuccinia psidii MF-1]
MTFQINSPSQSPISKEGFSPLVLQFTGATRRPFKDPNSLAFQVLVTSFQQYPLRALQGQLQEFFDHSNHFSKYKALQNSLDNSIDSYRQYLDNLYGSGPFGPIHIPL